MTVVNFWQIIEPKEYISHMEDDLENTGTKTEDDPKPKKERS